MLIFDLLIALLVAVVLALILAYPLGRRGPGPLSGLLFFLIILFLAAWAGGLWIGPRTFDLFGLAWIGFLGVGIILALILAAFAPARRPPRPPVTEVETTGEAKTKPPTTGSDAGAAVALTLGIFFYVALVLLIAAIVLHYVWIT